MKKKIAIIGHFGGNEIFNDGQTVKTKILYDELIKISNLEILKIDTYYKRKNPCKLMWDTLLGILQVKEVIVLLSGNGMRVYFPLLYMVSRMMNINVYHDVIGGNLDAYVIKYPRFKKYLNGFCVNWIETQGLKHRLEEVGITNCRLLPNFKRLRCISEDELSISEGNVYRFCTFSRVMKEKGIEEAIEAIHLVNKQMNNAVCELDIYGVVDESYKLRFDEILGKCSSKVNYCGVVPYDKSVEVIKNYYGLLFPTYWKGEGFPGTIIDAFSAALPVIATEWGSNGEFVKNKVNGVLYPNKDFENLESAIMYLIVNKDKMLEIKRACLRTAMIYQPDEYIKQIVDYIAEKK